MLVRVLPGRGIAGRVVWVLVVLLLAAVVVAASTPLVVGGPPEAVRHIMVGDLFLILEMGLAIVIARAAALQQESVLGQVQEARDLAQWQLTRARCLQWNEQRALARAMHGPAQSAVTSAVLRLEAAGSRGGVDEALVSAVRTDIVSALDTLGRDDQTTARVESALTQVAQTWAGVCEVTWFIPDAVHERLSADPLGSATVTELVSEGCWNAIRHAVASVVEVSLEIASPRAIRLTVRNDGPAPQTGEPGLGSRMFTDMTLSCDLVRDGDTTVLTALVPVS